MQPPSHQQSSLPGLIALLISLLLFVASAGGVGAAEQRPWQLTLCYHDDGSLHLVNSAIIPETRKTMRSPGANGALHSIPVELTWLDAGDGVIAGTHTTIPLGTRVPIQAGKSDRGVLLPEEVFVLRVSGPAPEASPRKIRISIVDPASETRGSAGTPATKRAALLKDQQILVLPDEEDPAFGIAPPPLPPSVETVTKIRNTGDDSNRLVIVVVGDGYTQSEIDDGTYDADVLETMAEFSNAPPWNSLMNATNIYRVALASGQSGADYEDGPPGVGTLKNTRYNSAFYTAGIERLLAPDSVGRSRAIGAADTYVGPGIWDQIVMVVNSPKYGGAGGVIATNSTNSAGPDISIHEVAHSFAGLADEYDYNDGATYTGSAPSEANVDTNGFNPKWSHWIDAGTPLPTPDSGTYSNKVGAFEGAKYNVFGIYRPWRSCKMRSTFAQFCPVCREQHLKTFFNLVEFTESVDPDPGNIVKVSSPQTLSVTSLPIGDIDYQWFRDGSPIPGENGPSINLSTSNLPAKDQVIMVDINYASDMMRTDAPSESYAWSVRNNGNTSGGTPHWWLASHGLEASDAADDIDHDGDGVTTGQEYVANTDPNDRSSAFRISQITVTPDSASGILRWNTESGRKYRLEKSTDLDHWDGVSGYTSITGDGGMIEYPIEYDGDSFLYFQVLVWVP